MGGFSSLLKLPDRQTCVVTNCGPLQKVRTEQCGPGLPLQVMNGAMDSMQAGAWWLLGRMIDQRVGSEAGLHGPESQCVDLAVPLFLLPYKGLMIVVTKAMS